jgi:DUF4097 and DUF4098 domain-containing protein YvlB
MNLKARMCAKQGAGVLVLVLVILALAGCGWVEDHYKYKKEVTHIEAVDLAGIDLVKMRLGSGDIVVMSDDVAEGEFIIKKTYRATKKDHLEEMEGEGEVTFERDGSTLIVERQPSRYPGFEMVSKGYVSIDIMATLPASLPLDIDTGSGDVEIDERTGRVWIDTGSGDVRIDGASGGLEAEAGSGDLRIGTAAAGVTLATGSGDVWADRIEGDVDLSTGSGDIDIGEVVGDLWAGTGSGDVAIDKSDGTAYVKTGSGDVMFRGHKGSAEVSTSSGEIEFYAQADEGTVSLRSSSGDVDVVVRDGESIELDIGTSSGTIDTKVPLVVEEASRKRLRGRMGEGRWKLNIVTSTGDISVRTGSI